MFPIEIYNYKLNPSYLVRLTFVFGEPWNEKWGQRNTSEFKETAMDVEAAVQELYEENATVDDNKITARVVNFRWALRLFNFFHINRGERSTCRGQN